MAKLQLTAGRIRDLECPSDKAQLFLWDATAPGLGVRATTAGGKAFIFQAKLNGQALRITIGDTRTWGIDGARSEARRLYALVDKGIDPRQEKAERIAAGEAKREKDRRQEAPALEAWQTYMNARRPHWGAKHLRDHDVVSKEGGEPRTRGRRPGEPATTLPGILRPLLLLPLSQIDAERVREWMREEAPKRPTHTRLAYSLLRAFLTWCSNEKAYKGEVQADACPARLAQNELPKKQAKDDCLQREQLPLWFEHVRKLPNPVQSAYLQALLLTGARPGELVGIRWEDVDFQWKALTIRDKVEGERTIPLCPYVAALLAALPRRNEWVFSSPTAADGRLVEPRYSHGKALSAAALPALTLHGLRRSFGTLAEWVECPAGIAAQIMGHKPSATAEKHYRVRPLDLLRMWHSKIEGWILKQAGLEQPQEEAQGLRSVK